MDAWSGSPTGTDCIVTKIVELNIIFSDDPHKLAARLKHGPQFLPLVASLLLLQHSHPLSARRFIGLT